LEAGIGNESLLNLSDEQLEKYLTVSFRYLKNDTRFCFPPVIETEMENAQVEFSTVIFKGGEQALDSISQNLNSFSIGRFSQSYRKGNKYDPNDGFGYGALVDSYLRRYLCKPKSVTLDPNYDRRSKCRKTIH